MNYKHTLSLIFVVLLGFAYGKPVAAQMSYEPSNSWIKHGQPYVKILVNAKGIHKVAFSSLPSGFPVDQPEKLQLWHLGKQEAIISIANNEIVFYGVPNMGDTDSLLYRPMTSRLNPYYSLYSDESAYFLTVSETLPLRAKTISKAADDATAIVDHHRAKDVMVLKTDYSLSTNDPLRANFFNSFFEKGVSRTGPVILKNTLTKYSIQLSDRVPSSVARRTVKLLMHGRSNNLRNVEVHVGKTEQSLRLAKVISSSNFEGADGEFELAETDLDEAGKGVICLKSTSNELYERFSLGYYSISYDQTLNMQAKKTREFLLPTTSGSWNRISISGVATGSVVYDITDTVKIIAGNPANLMIPRNVSKESRLLVTSESVTIPASKVSLVTFQKFDPTASNYLIITSDNLMAACTTYAGYRASAAGGAFKPLLVNIKDIYNQFNYGEVSPIAIRKFVDFMLSDGNKNKYLFLVGKSITFAERMKRELPDEVPTIGFPGSDILLVEGLSGTPNDVPAIPVGRLSPLTNEDVLAYLQKVKDYEQNDGEDLGWRKRALHVNGGKTVGEITQLKNLLASLVPKVENGLVGGKVKPFVKQQAIGEVEKVNITPEVNAGVGMITYFGHGSPSVTDLDMGYITDVARGYSNLNKYPLMYFNGCGVGNVFSARFNTSPTAGGDRLPLSVDWMLAPNKGAIAVIANSFESYVTPSSRYLNTLYRGIFEDESTAALSIGKIQASVANKIVSEGANGYDIANIHQSLLQGDPALKLVSVPKPDYAMDPAEGILIYSESAGKTIANSSVLRMALILSNHGKFVKEQQVPIRIGYEYQDGTVEWKLENIAAIAYQDTLFWDLQKNERILRLIVKIDPDGTIAELSETNNNSELVVDWGIANGQSMYPTELLKDLIAPSVEVTFDRKIITNKEVVNKDVTIAINLEDDRFLQADSSQVEVFIKPCGNDTCEFVKLSYSNDLEMLSLTDRSYLIQYKALNLSPGSYEILVNARDASGNTVINPYQIEFRVSGEDVVNKLFITPNPASDYVRFKVESNNQIISAEWSIYNISGFIQESGIVGPSESSDITEWYWLPQPSVHSGNYVYKVMLKWMDGKEEQFTGRVAIVN